MSGLTCGLPRKNGRQTWEKTGRRTKLGVGRREEGRKESGIISSLISYNNITACFSSSSSSSFQGLIGCCDISPAHLYLCDQIVAFLVLLRGTEAPSLATPLRTCCMQSQFGAPRRHFLDSINNVAEASSPSSLSTVGILSLKPWKRIYTSVLSRKYWPVPKDMSQFTHK